MVVDREDRAPVLVLGLGNRLLSDDGVGLDLLQLLQQDRLQQKRRQQECRDDPRVEFVDGGTQGLALLGLLDGRSALLVLDAVDFGVGAGHVHVVDDPLSVRMSRGSGAHEGNAGELLAAALWCGSLPSRVVVVGIEPARLETNIGLSEPVAAALPLALERARTVLDGLLAQQEVSSCTK